MYEKYIDKFFATEKITEKETYDNLFKKLEEYDKFIVEWKNEDLDDFIIKLNSISVNTINKYLQFIRDFYKYLCNQLNVIPKNLELTKDLKHYIDIDELLRRRISYKQYTTIKNLLTVLTPQGLFNYRDKVLFQLPWEIGLSNEEIKNLRVDDIEFYQDRGKERAKITIRSKDPKKIRYSVIENEEFIYDLRRTIEQKEYYIIEEGGKGRQYFRKLKDTPMLIKPMAIRQSSKDVVANPSQLLNRVLMKFDGIKTIAPEINLSMLGLEDIKRSRVIELLKNPNITPKTIKDVYDKKSECDLYWLKEIANIIKRKEKEINK
jgi:hypothetical protein